MTDDPVLVEGRLLRACPDANRQQRRSLAKAATTFCSILDIADRMKVGGYKLTEAHVAALDRLCESLRNQLTRAGAAHLAPRRYHLSLEVYLAATGAPIADTPEVDAAWGFDPAPTGLRARCRIARRVFAAATEKED